MGTSPDRIRDELLVLQCQGGDSAPLEQLVQRWQAPLLRHAWLLTQDVEGAKDVVQESWLDIVRSIRRLKEPSSFRGWAFRIVGNKAADWIRRTQRQRRLTQSRAESLNVTTIASKDESDATQTIRQGIAQLPNNWRQILSMKYLDEMSVNEIASVLEVPTGTVKSRLFHAREKLKQLLEKEQNNERLG